MLQPFSYSYPFNFSTLHKSVEIINFYVYSDYAAQEVLETIH